MWEGAKPLLAESGLVCSANAADLRMATEGEMPTLLDWGSLVTGKQGALVAQFGETTG